MQNGKDENGEDGKSKLNIFEASLVVDLVDTFIQAGDVKSADIGVITPYKAQVDVSIGLRLCRSNAVYVMSGVVRELRRCETRHQLLLLHC